MPSLFSEPAEFPWTAPLTGEEGLCADDPCVNSTLLCAPTGDSTLEATVGDNQGRATLHHSDEASLPLHLHNSHAEMEASLACLQFGSQPNLQTYETWPHGARGHVTIQAAQGHDSGNMRRRVQTVCIDCNKGFRRAQELARHRKDVHEQPRHCLFCGFKWTRPNSIKVHLLARHRGKFTAELLITIQALRGRMIVAFLDGYDQDSGGVEAFPVAPGIAHLGVMPMSSQNAMMSLDAPAPRGFPYPMISPGRRLSPMLPRPRAPRSDPICYTSFP